MEDRFRNQKGIIDGDKLSKTRFVIVGAGAIGSAVCLGLSKMGMRLGTVYDFDTLEDHNFANQLHPVSQLGKPKVESIVAVAKDYGDCTLTAINGPWTPGNAVDADVVISCVDNMDVRAALWEYYKGRGVFFIDGRMSAFVYKVFGVDVVDMARAGASPQWKHYSSTLHSQADAAPEPCGEKSIIFTVLVVAGMMLDQVKKFLNNEYRPTETVGDLYNLTMRHTYHMKQEIETIYAEDTEEEQKQESTKIPSEHEESSLEVVREDSSAILAEK